MYILVDNFYSLEKMQTQLDLPTLKDREYSDEEIALFDAYRERYREGVKLLKRAYREDIITRISLEEYERAIDIHKFEKVNEDNYKRVRMFRERVDKQMRYGNYWWRPTTLSIFKAACSDRKGGIRILKRYSLTKDNPIRLRYLDDCLVSAIYVPEDTKRVVLNLSGISFIYDENSDTSLKEILKESNTVPQKISTESLLKLSKSIEYDEKDYRKSKTICRDGVVYKCIELLYPFIPTHIAEKITNELQVVNDKDDFFYMEEIFMDNMYGFHFEKEYILFSKYSRYRVPVFVSRYDEVYNVQIEETIDSTSLMDCKIPPKNIRRMWDPEIITQSVSNFNRTPVD